MLELLLLLLLVVLLLEFILGSVLGFRGELGRGGLLLELLHLLEQGQVNVGLLLLLELELVLALLPFLLLLFKHSLLVELFHLLLEHLVGRLDADLLVGGNWLGDELRLRLDRYRGNGFRRDFRLGRRFRGLQHYRRYRETGHFPFS